MKPSLCKCKAKLATRNGIPVNKLCPKCREIKKTEKLEKHKTTKAYDKKTFKTLHKKCWQLISFIVRIKDAKNGKNSCYTCGIVKPWKELQAGHYWHGKLDFDTRNLRPQCPSCNMHKSGNLAVYGTKLLEENGYAWLRQLAFDAHNTIYKTQDLIKLLPLLQEEAKKYE